MCDDCAPPAFSRRRLGLMGLAAGASGLAVGIGATGTAGAAGGGSTAVPHVPAAPHPARSATTPGAVAMPDIRPRSTWGSALAPTGPLEVEAPGDVRFLLVHHTVGPNEYSAESVPDMIRSIFRMHTGGERNWPDVAYNFFVDRYGTIWEARQGSIDAPVKGSATGGSQGYALLCCFLGTHTDVPPTDAAQIAMSTLLAWLADRYDIDTAPGATTTFTSRGSNLHPAGSTVTAPTIAGHRDMSSTECPGDAAYALVRDAFPATVTNLRAAASTAATSTTAPPTTEPPPPPPTEPPVTHAPTTPPQERTSVPTTELPSTTVAAPTPDPLVSGEEGGTPVGLIAAAGTAGVAGLVGAGWYASRRSRSDADPGEVDRNAVDRGDPPVG